MADNIKLFYFYEFRGRGEFIRLLLTAAGQKFEDVRIKLENWGPLESLTPDTDVQKETPYGQLPYVIYKGKKHGQSLPIACYFAKKLGFYGTTDEDAMRQEEVMHLGEDLKVPHIKNWFHEEDPDKKAEIGRQLKDILFPRYLGYLEALLAENGDKGFFLGHCVTLADLHIFDILETVLGIQPEALKSFPLLKKLCQNVKTLPALHDYLANRLHTPA